MKILAAVATMIFFAVGAMAETTNDLSDAQVEGRALAQEILGQRPETNSTLTGLLKIRDSKGTRTEMPMKFEIVVTTTNWQSIYVFVGTNGLGDTNDINGVSLKITHANGQSNWYSWSYYNSDNLGRIMNVMGEIEWSGTRWTQQFPGDFLAMDFGLEFFQWPEQKVLKHEMKRGRSCEVLESTNPNPSMNGYSRVVSWIDEDSGGIVHAEAYDFKNKLLKEFDPKSFKKVNGQWQLQEMEISNVQTGSRSRIEFDLNK
jgi:hypothetical protein